MSALMGWPDRAQARPDGQIGVFEGPGAFALPQSVALAIVDGRPRLSLDLFRREDDPSDGDGMLELELVLGGFGEGAPAPWRDGWLTTGVRAGASEVVISAPVQPNGPAGLRATHRLDLDTAELLADAIDTGRSQLVTGRLDVIVPVVAVRAAAEVTFDPSVVTAALPALAGGPGGVTRDRIAAALGADPLSIGVTPTSGELGPDAAAALADRLIDRFAEIGPPADLGVTAGFTFTPAPAGSYTWNLNEPAPTKLVVTIPFEPLAALGAVADRASIVARTTVPLYDVGGRNVLVRANLPDRLVGIDQVRARLRLPSLAGVRPAAQAREAVVYPVSDRAGAVLGFRNGPGLPFSYERRVAVLVTGVAALVVSPPAVSDRPLAIVTTGDLPFAFAPVSATEAVLKWGELQVTADYARGGGTCSLTTALTSTEPAATLAVPSDATDATLTLVLLQRDGTGVIELGTRAFGPVLVDIDQLAAAGSHTVTIDVVMDGAPLAAFELAADDPSSPTPAEILAFTPDHQTRSWSYVAVNPFRPGVRHRSWVAVGSPPLEWSGPHDPSAPITLSAQEGG